DINKQIVFNAKLNLSDDQKKFITDKIISQSAILKNDMASMQPWMDLGIYYKISGDYSGAAEIWKFVSEYAPQDFVSLGNLGDLYGYYLNDKILSETYYKKAITVNPKMAYLYTQLSSVYKYVFKDMDKAKAIIDEGLKANPDDPALTEFRKAL
ncbi:MAG: hypothetical protein WAW92_01565, partial [Minisyncoccia bacterium]